MPLQALSARDRCTPPAASRRSLASVNAPGTRWNASAMRYRGMALHKGQATNARHRPDWPRLTGPVLAKALPAATMVANLGAEVPLRKTGESNDQDTLGICRVRGLGARHVVAGAGADQGGARDERLDRL